MKSGPGRRPDRAGAFPLPGQAIPNPGVGPAPPLGIGPPSPEAVSSEGALAWDPAAGRSGETAPGPRPVSTGIKALGALRPRSATTVVRHEVPGRRPPLVCGRGVG